MCSSRYRVFWKFSGDSVDCTRKRATRLEPVETAISKVNKRFGFMMGDTLFLFLARSNDTSSVVVQHLLYSQPGTMVSIRNICKHKIFF